MEFRDAKVEGQIIFLGLLGLPILTLLVAGFTDPRAIIEAYILYLGAFYLAGAFVPLVLGLRASRENHREWWIPHPG